VAYRFFASQKRRSPRPTRRAIHVHAQHGHQLYREPPVIWSTRKGHPTRRAAIANVAMMGVRNVVLAVNKMDLAGCSQDVRAHRGRLPAFRFRARFRAPGDPVSALEGDNVFASTRMPGTAAPR
jgi:hypothetical protein